MKKFLENLLTVVLVCIGLFAIIWYSIAVLEYQQKKNQIDELRKEQIRLQIELLKHDLEQYDK